MELKRVVVTGMGVLSPAGNSLEEVWTNLTEGNCNAGQITYFDASKFKTQFACELRSFDASSFLDAKELRHLDRFSQYALFTARRAMADSGLDLEHEDITRMGVVWGSGMGGVRAFEDNMLDYYRNDCNPAFSPFLIPKTITNIAAGHIAIAFGLRGVNLTTTSACATSAHSISEAFNYIRLGKATAILAGGSEAPIEVTGVGGFNAMRALSTRNDSPATASRPFSKSRDGFVMGEGSACLVLEEYEHAVSRGAHIYAELVGVGLSSDAYHITAPEPEGKGAELVMRFALEDAQLQPSQIDYINAHGTSTQLGDIAEVKAICRLFGEHAYHLNISSTKSVTGHLMGAAGAFEALVSVLALVKQQVPPTINHADDDVDENFDERINFTFNTPQSRQIRYAMSNSFGFGGHNVALIFKKSE
jgi:3-oxoacyl-[acyl-carrier-protein] synthase II